MLIQKQYNKLILVGNGSSAIKEFSKTQLSQTVQLGEILVDLLAAILQALSLTGVEAIKRGVKEV